MVKGVSKTIIEVNNTGSKIFEKIVFYVTPEYSTLNAKQLRKAAGNFSFQYPNTPPKKSLRKRDKTKQFLKLSAVVLTGFSLVVAALVVIL